MSTGNPQILPHLGTSNSVVALGYFQMFKLFKIIVLGILVVCCVGSLKDRCAECQIRWMAPKSTLSFEGVDIGLFSNICCIDDQRVVYHSLNSLVCVFFTDLWNFFFQN